MTREEADKLGWEVPRGVKVLRTVEGSPAATAGLEPGDVITLLDGVEVKDGRDLRAGLLAKGSGVVVKVRVLRAGREKTVSLGTTPPPAAVARADAPQLMLDTGGHATNVRGLAVTPDGKQIVSASQDKTVRVWDIEQLRQHLNRPDVIEKAILLASAEQDVREAHGHVVQDH
ncbi:MAG TPA: PDZ domain-containing protein [Hyphomicrobiaceae bacterium]|nr:PDZ domain-containing protein [Hyphomicrobiaceae bacterium]